MAAPGRDIFNGEPDISPGYRNPDNAFLLPHIGSAARETRAAMGFRALEDLDAIFAGREARRPGGVTAHRRCTWGASLFKLLVYRIQEFVESLGPDGPPLDDVRILQWVHRE